MQIRGAIFDLHGIMAALFFAVMNIFNRQMTRNYFLHAANAS